MTDSEESLARLETDDLLSLLRLLSDHDLTPIVENLTSATTLHSAGIQRLKDHPRFHKDRPNHRDYADLIADEIRWFGTHDAQIVWSGIRSPYRDIVGDLCDRAGIEVLAENEPAIELEAKLLARGKENAGTGHIDNALRWAPSAIVAVLPQIALQVVPRVAGATIPLIGSALTLLALGHVAWSQLGPSYRVLVPCIGHLADMRQRLWRHALRELGE
jgi:uncharacterized protein YaaW (UPF0174 family)